MFTKGTTVEVFIDASDGTMSVSGRLDEDYNALPGEPVRLTRGSRHRLVPGNRVLYVQNDEVR